MRKTTAIIFLVCILINTGGYQLVPFLYRLGLKAEMKAYILENPQSHFKKTFHFTTESGTVTDPEFYWADGMNEFSYKGNMYDVIASHAEKQQITLYCINDLAETDLAEIENEICGEKSKESNDSKSNSIKLIFTFFDLPPNNHDTVFFVFTIDKYTSHVNEAANVPIDILSPPPKIMFA